MKVKNGFLLGTAIAASCFISAYALAEQYPTHTSEQLTRQAIKQAVKQALKAGGKVEAKKVSPTLMLKAQAAQQAKASGPSKAVSKAAARSAPYETVLSAPGTNVLKQSQTKAASEAQAAFVPLCDTLEINNLYTLSNTQTGASICYHFNVPKKAKATVLLVGQSAGTNMALTLFQDDGQNNLIPLGTSDSPGNGDESLSGILEAGDYYWFMQANTADGSDFSFGADVNSNIDDYEPNDTAQTARALPDALNQITGNLDSPTDVDYFDFTAVRGQSVSMYLGDDKKGTRNQWIFERFDGANWITIPANATSTYPTLAPNAVVKVRVRANPEVTWNGGSQYKLSLGSSPRLNSSDVQGDSVVRIPNSAPTAYGYMTTQAAKTLTWSTNWSDSTGAPLLGVTPVLRLDQDWVNTEINYKDHEAKTNSAGTSTSSVTLGACNYRYQTQYQAYSGPYLYTWDTTYDYGA